MPQRPMTANSERRKASGKLFKALRRSWRKLKGDWPAEDPEYLKWLRHQRCAVPNCRSFERFRPYDVIEAAHVGAIRGLRQKCSDREAISLCAWHHRIGAESHHVLGKTFWLYWDLDREEVISEFNQRYESERA